MDRRIPVFNRVVIEKTQRKNMESHLKRLEDIRANNRKSGLSSRIAECNPKKDLIEEQKRTEIQKQNVLLYNKMSKILNRAKSRTVTTFHAPVSDSRFKSLCRIQLENKQIVKRIENQKPTICNKKLYDEYSKKQRLLSFIGAYPNRSRVSILNQSNMSWSVDNKRNVRTPPSNEGKSRIQRKFQKMEQSFSRDPAVLPSVRQTRQYPSQQPTLQRENTINLFRRRILIDGQVYLVLINRLYQSYQFVLQDDEDKSYRMVIPEPQGNKVLTDYDYDYGFICSCLKLNSGVVQLIIDRPREETPNLPSFNSEMSRDKKMLFNEAKLKGYKLRAEKLQAGPQFMTQSQKCSFMEEQDDYLEEEMEKELQLF